MHLVRFFYYLSKINMDLSDCRENMNKTLEYLKNELKSIQVGRATPTMLDNVNVETNYGAMKLPQMWHITVLDAMTIKVEAWDKKELWNIEKGIYAAKLWVAPKNEGEYILVKVPELTQERREEIVKKVKNMAEDTKAHLRVARHDAQKDNKKLLEAKEISEDEHKNNDIDIDNMMKEYTAKIEEYIKEKSEDVMKI